MPINKVGSWVLVSERLPKTSGIKITQTKENVLGIGMFYGGEWVHLLPTYMGEFYKWFETTDAQGNELEFITDLIFTKKETLMKKQSAGTIIVNENFEILMAHVTNSSPEIWDLPKGMIEDNESPIDAAIRECKEEFGITLDRSKLVEIGNCAYNSQKNIWVFITMMDKKDVDLSSLICDSMFLDVGSGKESPEVDGYKWMKFADVPYDCAKSMNKLLHQLHSKINIFIKYGVVDIQED